jgi:hypothetical protein
MTFAECKWFRRARKALSRTLPSQSTIGAGADHERAGEALERRRSQSPEDLGDPLQTVPSSRLLFGAKRLAARNVGELTQSEGTKCPRMSVLQEMTGGAYK